MHKPESRDAVDQKFFCLTEIQVCTMTKRLQLDYMLCDDIPMLIGFDMQTNRKCSTTLSSCVLPEHYHILFSIIIIFLRIAASG